MSHIKLLKGNNRPLTKYPLVPASNHLLRPEDKNNKRLHDLWLPRFERLTQFSRWSWRARIYCYHLKIASDKDIFIQKYSHRWNLQPLFFLFLLSSCLGCIGHYLNHKINVIEPKWVEDYGQDYPCYKPTWLYRWGHYHRIASFHF